MIDPKQYRHVVEAYQTGDAVLRVVVQFNDPTDFRVYRLFAERQLTPPIGAVKPIFVAHVERERRLTLGAKETRVWCRASIPAPMEAENAEEALHRGLSLLDELATGHLHDDEGPT